MQNWQVLKEKSVTELERVWRKGILLHCWQECKLVQPLWKTLWRLLNKLKVEFLEDPAILFLGKYPEKNYNSKRSMHPYIHSNTIYSSQDMETS